MELTQLRHFVVVARTENITKAAKELFITQPALSRTILRLEHELGTPLFDRSGGRLTLNNKGKVFLEFVKPALDSLDEGVRAIADESDSREIVIHNYLSADMFKSIAERCQAEFPNMTFSVKNIGDNINEDALSQSSAEIVMLPTNDFAPYTFPMSYMERWCVIYNSKYKFHSEFDGKFLSLEQLLQEPIAFSGSHYDREFLYSVFENAGTSPKIVYCDTLADSSAQINRCKTVGFVPVSNFRSLMKNIDSIPISAAVISDMPCQRMLYLGVGPGFLSDAAENEVLDYIKNYLSNEYAKTDTFYEEYFGQQ